MSDIPQIPLIDLNAINAQSQAELARAMARVLRSGQFILGEEVAAFEAEIADFLGISHAIGVSCGSDALVIALRAAGIGEGDEVVTSAFGFVATPEAIVRAGATPVLVDVDPHTLTLDPERVEAALSTRSRAILPVHIFGRPADMDTFAALADDQDLLVIEDAAQALGGRLDENALGTLGTAGAFSFFPSKNLGAMGDGGLVVTDDEDIAQRARALRQHGCEHKHIATEVGLNARLDALQAAILRAKLPRLEAHNRDRRHLAARYDAAIAGLDGLEPVGTPVPRGVTHAFAHYCVRVANNGRDALQAELAARGIATAVYYPRGLHELEPYRRFAHQRSLPVTEAACAEVLALPLWPGMGELVQDRVIDVLCAVVGPRPRDKPMRP